MQPNPTTPEAAKPQYSKQPSLLRLAFAIIIALKFVIGQRADCTWLQIGIWLAIWAVVTVIVNWIFSKTNTAKVALWYHLERNKWQTRRAEKESRKIIKDVREGKEIK